MSGDLAAFRASHASVADAIKQCDRPDWALQLAFDAASDKRAVIANGANIARVLKSDNLFLTLITPRPTPLEAVDVFSDNTDDVSKSLRISRALMIAAYLSIPLVYLIVRFGIGTKPGGAIDTGAMAIGFAISAVVITVVTKVAIDWVIRRQVARLDDRSAMQRVLELVTKRMENNPRGIRKAMTIVKLGLPRLVS